jgi:hypothetical protein
MTSHPTEVKLPESLEAIRALCAGYVEWRVCTDDGAYCMSFNRDNSRNPEQEANEWLAKHLADYPHRFMPYKVQRVVVQSQLQEEALALIARLSDAESDLKARDAEIERLRGDAERLDWLDGLNCALNKQNGTTYQWKLVLSPNVVRLMAGRHDKGYIGDIDLHDSDARGVSSCRTAIDQVRATGGEKAK